MLTLLDVKYKVVQGSHYTATCTATNSVISAGVLTSARNICDGGLSPRSYHLQFVWLMMLGVACRQKACRSIRLCSTVAAVDKEIAEVNSVCFKTFITMLGFH